MADAVQDKKLFPDLPESLADLSDTEIEDLEREHVDAAESIRDEDEEFLKGLSAEEILAEFERGVEQTLKIREYREQAATEHENYKAKKDEIFAKIAPPVEVEAEAEVSEEEDSGDEGDGDDGAVSEEVEEKELVLASADPEPEAEVQQLRVRRSPPPAPSPERIKVEETPSGTALVAAGEMSLSFPEPLNENTLAKLVRDAAAHHGTMPKIDPPGKYRFGGPEHKIAKADFGFPEDRTLSEVDATENLQKIEALGNPFFGQEGREALLASGGICAPPTPIYSMVNFGSEAEPVWDSLPVFRAERGGVIVPTSNTIGDITTAISSISEANDALGGTFATKSCQALTCPDLTTTYVQILAHCREYGNLNARTWPEWIAHENALTMQALARTSETFILEGIKALSVNVTSGANTLSALTYLVDAIAKSAFGIRGRLRMPNSARFRVLLPIVMLDMLLVDAVQQQFDRYKTRGDLDAYLRAIGVDPVYYMDGDFAAGDDMIPDADQAAGALESWPNTFQWALYPEGTFLGIDSGTLELGIVRDSTLNATNDFQVFGERFRNVVRVGPAQAAYWETTTLCAVGSFPPAGTARTCES